MQRDNNVPHKIPIRTEDDGPAGADATEPDVPTANGGEPDWKVVARNLQADMKSFRERQRRQAEDAVVSERARLLKEILPVYDNLERALRVDNPKDLVMWKGIAMVRREVTRVLENEGVTRIDTMGKLFDPEIHEAVGRREAEAKPGTIIDEVLPGFMIGERLLRAPQVIIAA
jgi:molecular chaperone GrpE